MILKFIIKYLKAYKKLILGGFLAHLLMGSIFTFRYYPWHVYTMYGYLVIAFISSFYLFSEKKRAAEILTVTLPGSRSTIVMARYLTSIIIAIFGIMLWLVNAYISEFIYQDAMSHFQQIARLKVLFMALLFISIQLSIFLPAAFSCRIFGMVSTFVIALITAILSIPLIFHAYKSSYNPYFEIGDVALVAFLALFVIFAPLISAAISMTLYKTRDL